MSQSHMASQLLDKKPQNLLPHVKQVANSSSPLRTPQLLHGGIRTPCFSVEQFSLFSYPLFALCSEYHDFTNFVKRIRKSRMFTMVKRAKMDTRTTTLHRLIAQAVEAYKELTGLSYKEIAAKCGISPSQFSEVLRRKSRLSAEQVERICEGLGTTLQEIVNKDIIEGQIKPKFPGMAQTEYELIAKAVLVLRTEEHRKTLTDVINMMHDFLTPAE